VPNENIDELKPRSCPVENNHTNIHSYSTKIYTQRPLFTTIKHAADQAQL